MARYGTLLVRLGAVGGTRPAGLADRHRPAGAAARREPDAADRAGRAAGRRRASGTCGGSWSCSWCCSSSAPSPSGPSSTARWRAARRATSCARRRRCARRAPTRPPTWSPCCASTGPASGARCRCAAGCAVLALLPGLVALASGLGWDMLCLMPGLVASGGSLLFGVNAFCLDGRGALWRDSLPVSPRLVFVSRVVVLAEVLLVAIGTTLLMGTLRAGSPSVAQVASVLSAALVVTLQVVSGSLRWSVRRPYAADLRGARATPAPPLVMVGYSTRLALATTVTGLVFATTTLVPGLLGPGPRAAVPGGVRAAAAPAPPTPGPSRRPGPASSRPSPPDRPDPACGRRASTGRDCPWRVVGSRQPTERIDPMTDLLDPADDRTRALLAQVRKLLAKAEDPADDPGRGGDLHRQGRRADRRLRHRRGAAGPRRPGLRPGRRPGGRCSTRPTAGTRRRCWPPSRSGCAARSCSAAPGRRRQPAVAAPVRLRRRPAARRAALDQPAAAGDHRGWRGRRPPPGESVAAYRRSWLAGFTAAVGQRLAAAEDRAADEARTRASGRASRGRASVALVLADRGVDVERAARRRSTPSSAGPGAATLSGSGRRVRAGRPASVPTSAAAGSARARRPHRLTGSAGEGVGWCGAERSACGSAGRHALGGALHQRGLQALAGVLVLAAEHRRRTSRGRRPWSAPCPCRPSPSAASWPEDSMATSSCPSRRCSSKNVSAAASASSW